MMIIDWQPLLEVTATIVIPLGGLMWVMHQSAATHRQRLEDRIEHVHACVERRSESSAESIHRLELRLVAIETRGLQFRHSDRSENGRPAGAK